MKFYLMLSVLFLTMINVALGAVGDVGISDTASSLQPEQGFSAGADSRSASSQSSGALAGYPGILDTQGSYPVQGMSTQVERSAYLARGAAASAPSGYSNAAASMTAAALPSGAPIPPDPGSERLILPDFNLYRPVTDQSSQSGFDYPSLVSSQPAAYPNQFNAHIPPTGTGLVENPAMVNPALVGYPDQAVYVGAGSLPGHAGSSTKACTTCTSSTVITGGVSSSYPYAKSCPTCAAPASQSTPCGYTPQSYKAVYPVPSICKCNEYYVQNCPGRLVTVAGVFCGEWLPLWSKVSRPGEYWSYEWTACGSWPSYYCPPEAKNFGYKCAGWYQTWFKGNNPGWHILSYYSNDWSNYIYIYVWPAD